MSELKTKMIQNYPHEMSEGSAKEKSVDNFIITYFQLPSITAVNMESSATKMGPFCCENLKSYKNIRNDKESLFQTFLSGKGTVSEVLFEVKEQVDNGPLIGTKYFRLCN